MKCLITGGAGFIGSHIQDLLLENGHTVGILDNLSTGKKENINSSSTLFEADITNREQVEKVFEQFQPEAVFHLAAQTSVPYSMEHPEEDLRTNILGSMNVFLTAAKFNVKKVVYTNTGGAYYGEVPEDVLPVSEDFPVHHPTSFYGVSKYCAEQYLRLINQMHPEMSCVVLRYANVYGPRQEGNHEAGIIAIFLKKMLHGEQCTINGDGKHTRDYVCVLDVAKANLKALEYVGSNYFNIATGIETSNIEVYDLLTSKLGITTPATFGPERAGDAKRNSLSIQKAKDILGWEPEYTLEKGTEVTIEFYKNQTA